MKGFVFSALVGAVVWFAADNTWGVVVGLVLAALTIVASIVIRWSTDYAITNERLHIRRGVFARTIQETRLGRVQNVTVSQGVWERLLRIGTAEFDTASDEQNDFVFAGIANPDQVRAAVDHAHRYAERQQAAAPQEPTSSPPTGGPDNWASGL